MSKTAKEAKRVVEEESAEEQSEEQPEEEPVQEAKPKKVKPVKVKPKKKKSKGVYGNYRIEEGKIKRMLPFCERCGPGYFMANHGNRYTCGHCGFTRYKPAQPANE